jgi:hypothetical protein
VAEALNLWYNSLTKGLKGAIMKKLLLIMALVGISGCATINSTLTPGVSVEKDAYDDMTIIKQAPVSSASSWNDAWHTLGFSWYQKFPDKIFLDVGVCGTTDIIAVNFKIDDIVIEGGEASTTTDYGNYRSQWSIRRFSVSLNDFIKIATASDVRMKVYQINTYSVSRFGSAYSDSLVNVKIKPFMEKVREALINL